MSGLGFNLEWDSQFDPENAKATFESMLSTADRRLVAVMTQTALNVERGARQRSRRDTGTMANAWNSDVDSRGETIVAEIGNETHYAPYHEYGTQDIEPAPMLRPSLDEETRRLERRVRLAVLEATEQAGGV